MLTHKDVRVSQYSTPRSCLYRSIHAIAIASCAAEDGHEALSPWRYVPCVLDTDPGNPRDYNPETPEADCVPRKAYPETHDCNCGYWTQGL